MGSLMWLFQFLLYVSQYQLAFSSSSPSSFSSSTHSLYRHGQTICNARSLEILDLSHNNLSGAVPQCLGNFSMTLKGIEIEMQRIFTIFTTIDFSSNNFIGEIPNVIGKLNSLIVLNFSHNSLKGHIPESLGNLTSLESLDISSNKLTGRIPSQLVSLTFLEVLNLSWNRLHGPIPQGLQFNTFQNGSYAGNLGLCGLPLSKECEDSQTKVHPPVLPKEEDDHNFDGLFWKIVAIGYGCGMTLGLFLGSLMFLIGRPKLFVRLAEREMPKKVIRLRRTLTDTVGRRKYSKHQSYFQ
ncbi:hypothetical protein RHGRI_000608 [Rhododendron griersonianum]|uniref:Uncharacterized protein n=1 Tax=Rhododendron griersonianum TaxID=479676 RepID=A0AAV6LIH0_9ERIC|nr:hypothetical protein RHGRI_000608 [Rhododendron griersonianum]